MRIDVAAGKTVIIVTRKLVVAHAGILFSK